MKINQKIKQDQQSFTMKIYVNTIIIMARKPEILSVQQKIARRDMAVDKIKGLV